MQNMIFNNLDFHQEIFYIFFQNIYSTGLQTFKVHNTQKN